MPNNLITQATIGLSEKYVPVVIQFIEFLKSGYDAGDTMSVNTDQSMPQNAVGLFKGSLKYMADDFNEPLQEFEEYM